MSGCANCVWLDYADEVVDFYSRKGESGVKVDQILKESDIIGYTQYGLYAKDCMETYQYSGS